MLAALSLSHKRASDLKLLSLARRVDAICLSHSLRVRIRFIPFEFYSSDAGRRHHLHDADQGDELSAYLDERAAILAQQAEAMDGMVVTRMNAE